MPTLVILNPSADLGNGVKYLDTITEETQSFDEVKVALTLRSGHASALAREAGNEGYDVLIAAGGDGTVNEVVNGMMEAGSDGVRLGILPIGTGNDFAHDMDISADVVSLFQSIIDGRTRKVDIALMEDDKGNRRYIANNMGVGFDANVVVRTSKITRLHGFPKYLLGVLTTLARDFYPINLHVRFDQEEVKQKILFLYMGVGTRGGGGFLVTPDASHEDDLIDSCTVPWLARIRALLLINSVTEGRHVHTPYVTMRQNKQIVINSVEAMPIQIDGEIYALPEDDIHQVMVTSIPAAIEVIV